MEREREHFSTTPPSLPSSHLAPIRLFAPNARCRRVRWGLSLWPDGGKEPVVVTQNYHTLRGFSRRAGDKGRCRAYLYESGDLPEKAAEAASVARADLLSRPGRRRNLTRCLHLQWWQTRSEAATTTD